jgi:PadR family transcriptional regulator, regulatory protein PadR
VPPKSRDSSAIPSLSSKEAEVLAILGGGESFGLQIVDASGRTIARGTIYVTLGRMEEKGFVTSREDPRSAGSPGMPRRLYRATALGAAAVRARNDLAIAMKGWKVTR